jgi:hypothetical protein
LTKPHLLAHRHVTFESLLNQESHRRRYCTLARRVERPTPDRTSDQQKLTSTTSKGGNTLIARTPAAVATRSNRSSTATAAGHATKRIVPIMLDVGLALTAPTDTYVQGACANRHSDDLHYCGA